MTLSSLQILPGETNEGFHMPWISSCSAVRALVKYLLQAHFKWWASGEVLYLLIRSLSSPSTPHASPWLRRVRVPRIVTYWTSLFQFSETHLILQCTIPNCYKRLSKLLMLLIPTCWIEWGWSHQTSIVVTIEHYQYSRTTWLWKYPILVIQVGIK